MLPLCIPALGSSKLHSPAPKEPLKQLEIVRTQQYSGHAHYISPGAGKLTQPEEFLQDQICLSYSLCATE